MNHLTIHCKNGLLIILISAAVAPGWGQIGGISGGKLFTPDAFTLAQGVFEFEPAYELQGDGRGFGFRFTAGFGKLEAGVSLDHAVASQAVGIKYRLNPERLVVIAGVEYDTTFNNYAAGLLYSHPFNEKFTTDVFATATGEGKWAVMAAAGYFITNRFQPIVELVVNQDLKPSISSGFTYAPNEMVLVVIGVEQTFGNGEKPLLSVAFTFSMQDGKYSEAVKPQRRLQ